MPSEKGKKKLFSATEILFKLMYAGLFNESIEVASLDELLTELKSVPDFIAITSNKAFLHRDGDLHPQTGFIGAIGSGTRSIIPCYYVVRDVKTAFKLSSQIDTQSTAEYQSVMAESLTPYVVE